jgi:RNA polymerase sigma factor (sigma-70 family)
VVRAPQGDDSCNAEVLTELVLRGDAAALDRITRCYGERLLEAGRRHCRTLGDAEDAVQDALLSAATNQQGFRGDGSLEGWLVRIVARACQRLSRGRKNDTNNHDTDAVLRDSSDSPELWAQRSEVARWLDQTLLGLGPEDRLILLLAELEDFTAPEIAARTGLSAGAVRTRLTRLRASIRQRYVEAFGGEIESS